MQSSRLKNIIILILLLTNLSLAAVVVSRQADHQEGLEQVRQQLVTLFAAENVELDEDLISSQTPPLSRTLTRDTQQEDDLAACAGPTKAAASTSTAVTGAVSSFWTTAALTPPDPCPRVPAHRRSAGHSARSSAMEI